MINIILNLYQILSLKNHMRTKVNMFISKATLFGKYFESISKRI